MPTLQSADMLAVGGGYDSADPAVIAQHVSWLETMGIDAALIDLTNNVPCIFNSAAFDQQYVANCTSLFRSENQTIRDNTGNLYPAWTNLRTPLKLIPLLSGADAQILIADSDGKTAFENEIEYFGALMARYPQRNVIYEGKPLMVIFLGAAQDPDTSNNPLWFQLRQFLAQHPDISSKYTFKMVAGYLDAQPGLWAAQAAPNGPVEISSQYGFWSWVDRLSASCTLPGCPYYPSFNRTGSGRVENFTVSIATAGANGWGCPNANSLPYCPDDALRFGAGGSYATFESFMSEARRLDPIFLIIHQFNEFVPPDEGFDANTDDDIEPADLWGAAARAVVAQEIFAYRRARQKDRR